MNKTESINRQIKNESMFRQANERVQKELDKIKDLEKASDNTTSAAIYDVPLHFFCECSDENCQERIVIKPSLYKDIHKDRKQFLIKPVHEVPAIEKVVHKKSKYSVVKKFIKPPETVKKLQLTDIKNV